MFSKVFAGIWIYILKALGRNPGVGVRLCVNVRQQSSKSSLRLNGSRYKRSRCGVGTQLG